MRAASTQIDSVTGQTEATDAPALLHRLLVRRTVDDMAAEWLSFGFRRWLLKDDGLPPLLNFGLPSTPMRTRLAMRDFWLKQAARYVDGCSSWHRAQALLLEVARFQRYKQAAWAHYSQAPTHASPLEGALHSAAQAWPEFPTTPQALRNILEAD